MLIADNGVYIEDVILITLDMFPKVVFIWHHGVLFFTLDGGIFIFPLEGISHLSSVNLYTTLFTSVWIVLFVVGRVLVRFFAGLMGGMDVDTYPVAIATTLGGIFLAVILMFFLYIRLLITF